MKHNFLDLVELAFCFGKKTEKEFPGDPLKFSFLEMA